MAFVVLVVCICLLSEALGSACNTKYQIADVCSQSYGRVLMTIYNVTSLARCAAFCCNDIECASVVLDSVNQTCTINSEFATKLTPGCGLKYASFCQSECKDMSNIGSACTTPGECIGTGTTCLNYTCTCDAGYSFSPSDNLCVEFCSGGYGSTFAKFDGQLLIGYNKDSISDSDPESCQIACLAATEYVCRTFEMSTSGDCFLSVETALTKPHKFTEGKAYTYYQRNCK